MSTSRERIVEAATHEITRKGPLGLRVQDVASGAGVSVPLIYKYFADRDGLLVETLGSMFEQRATAFIERVEQFMLSSPDFVVDDLVDALAVQSVVANREIRWLRLRALAAASELPALRERLQVGQLAMDRRATEFATKIGARFGSTSTMSPRQFAFLMQSVSFGLVLDDLRDRDAALCEEDYRVIFRALFHIGLHS